MQKLYTYLSDNKFQHSSNYLVNSSKCKIPSLDPYNNEILPYFSPKSYIKCSKKHALTYVTKRNNTTILQINERFLKEYTSNTINCCYRIVTRGISFSTPDMLIDVSACIHFFNNTILKDEVVIVSCMDESYNEVYKNVHNPVIINDEVKKKMKTPNASNKENLSVLFLGIDSISRLNLVRSMPHTYHFLQQNDWIEFKGYNKIGDNTFPNLMGIFTGMNESTAFKMCNPRILGELDKCNIIWYDYRNLGFVTAYAEDEIDINTFNYLKKGFIHQPTDYYFRPYILATEKYLDPLPIQVIKYCTGPESAGERIFNVVRDFSTTFLNYSSFGFFWTNSFSHNEVNAVSRMDAKVAELLSDIDHSGILNNTIVFFISDHGFRFGTITYTHAGWLEERLPFFYISIPNWFKMRYAQKYENLIKNSERLTTPYDLYMTLQDILVISGKHYNMKSSSACPKCQSLFEEIENDRSCEDAGIERHWCTCNGYFTISPNGLLIEEAAKFILSKIHKTVFNGEDDIHLCSNFELKNIISAGISDISDIWKKKRLYFLVTFETKPYAVFQGTVSIDSNNLSSTFKTEGSISRLDIYSTHSWCVTDAILKKYCYCQGGLNYIFRFISSVVKNVKHSLFS